MTPRTACALALLTACAAEPTRSPKVPPKERYARPDAVVTELAARSDHYEPSPDTTPIELDEASRRYLLKYGRKVCDGHLDGARALAAPVGFTNPSAPVIAVLFAESGGRKAHHRADTAGATLTANLEAAAESVCAEVASGDQLHLMPVTFTARLPNFGHKGVFEYKVFEPQVHGLAAEWHGKRAESDPLLQLEDNDGPKTLQKRLSEALGSKSNLFLSDNDLVVEIYQVEHFGERRTDGSFADYQRGHTVLRPEDATTEAVRRRLDLIGEYYRNNVFGGEIVYEYSTSSGAYRNNDRTMVRSLMSTWVMNRLAFFLDDQALKDLSAEVIEHYLTAYFQIEQSRVAGKILPSDIQLPNGNTVPNRYTAASFLGAAILERDDRDRWIQDDRLLMEWAMGFQRPDGVMYTQFPQSQFFMPGHLMLSLAYHHIELEDPTYKTWFDGIYDTYEGPLYQMMTLADERYHPLAPAWFTQPAAAMYHHTGDTRYRDLIYAINDRVVKLHDHNRRHMVHDDYDGILTPKLGYYGNNSVTAAALESLADAAIVAKADGDMERYRRYTTVVRHATAYLMRIQFTPDNTYYVKHRERVVGGFKKDLVNSLLWMDSVWHLTSAFIKIHDAKLLDDAPVAEPLP